MPRTMLQEEVYFEVTLAYKIKMHGRPNFRWPSVLFPRLKGPDIGQTSKGLTELSTTYDQNPPKSQLTAIPFSQNPKLAGCSHFVGCAEDSFFKILVWKRRNKRHQRARESGTKTVLQTASSSFLQRENTVQHVQKLLGYLFSWYQMRFLQSFNRYLLSPYCGPATILGSRYSHE